MKRNTFLMYWTDATTHFGQLLLWMSRTGALITRSSFNPEDLNSSFFSVHLRPPGGSCSLNMILDVLKASRRIFSGIRKGYVII